MKNIGNMDDSITASLKFNFKIQFIGWKLVFLNHAFCHGTALVKYIIKSFYFSVKKLILSITKFLRYYTYISFFKCIFIYIFKIVFLFFFPFQRLARDFIWGDNRRERFSQPIYLHFHFTNSHLCIILVAAFDTIFLLEDNCQKKEKSWNWKFSRLLPI